MKNNLDISVLRYCLGLIFVLNISTIQAQEALEADQNPNYQTSLNKYLEQKDELIKHSNTTVHNTYKAIDDVAAKAEQKQARIQNRASRRLARANRVVRFNQFDNYYYGYRAFNPYPYHWGYSSFNRGFNRGCNNVNAITNTALLGLGVYSLFR